MELGGGGKLGTEFSGKWSIPPSRDYDDYQHNITWFFGSIHYPLE